MLAPCKFAQAVRYSSAHRRTCHPGPCPPCQVALIVPCPSHHTGLTVKCAVASSNNAALTPVCDEICAKERNCGNPDHACEVSYEPVRNGLVLADISNCAISDLAPSALRSRRSDATVARKAKRSSAVGTARRRSDARRLTGTERRKAGWGGTAVVAAVPVCTIAVFTLANR
jgi:hypothetical protein